MSPLSPTTRDILESELLKVEEAIKGERKTLETWRTGYEKSQVMVSHLELQRDQLRADLGILSCLNCDNLTEDGNILCNKCATEKATP